MRTFRTIEFRVGDEGGAEVLLDGQAAGMVCGELTLDAALHWLSTWREGEPGYVTMPMRVAEDSVVVDRAPKSGVMVTVHFGPMLDESVAVFCRYECGEGGRYTEVKPTCADRVDLDAWCATRAADEPYPAPEFYTWRVESTGGASECTITVWRHPGPSRPEGLEPEHVWTGPWDSDTPDITTLARRVCEEQREMWLRSRDAGTVARDMFLLDGDGLWQYHWQSYSGHWVEAPQQWDDAQAEGHAYAMRGVPRG